MKKLLTLVLLFVFGISCAQDLKIINKEIKDSSVQLRYGIHSIYPQLSGMKDEKIQSKVNKEIYETMMKGIKDFKKDMSEWDVNDIPKDFNSEIDYNFTSYILTNDVFSFAFEIYSYYAGAAHPNHWSLSMNFELSNGKLLKFKDLFNPKAKYLNRISDYCIEDLRLQAKLNGYETIDDMLIYGAGPNDSNFMNFNLLQKGIQITFDPYQVAPYAAGTQFVMIPYSSIYEILNTEGILSKFDY
jgi:hypothetical protein